MIRQLAEFVASADAAGLPQLDRDILRRHAFDIAVSCRLGASSHEGQKLRRAFGPGLSADGVGGIAGLVRMTEMDDIHTGSTTTPSSVTVPVAMSLYAQGDATPQRLQSAIYVGTELLVRMGKAMDGSRALFKGFWPTRTGATLGAAATAARLFGLDVEQTEQALSLALMTTAGRSGRFSQEPSGRWIVFATAVAVGVGIAFAAREGFRGADVAPDAEWLATALGLDIDASQFTQGLGAGSVYPELSLKPYATARQGLGAIEAMRHLLANGLDPATINKVVVRVPSAHKAMISQKLDPQARGTAFVSVACQLATAALRPQDLYDIERRNVLGDPRIADFCARVEILAEPAFDLEFPEVWAAEVEVDTSAGTVKHQIREALGSPNNRMSDADLLHKSRTALGFFGEAALADELMALVPQLFESDAAARRMAAVFTRPA